jgi:hypothetical protein
MSNVRALPVIPKTASFKETFPEIQKEIEENGEPLSCIVIANHGDEVGLYWFGKESSMADTVYNLHRALQVAMH